MTLIKRATRRPVSIALICAILAILLASCGGGSGGGGDDSNSGGGGGTTPAPNPGDTTPPAITKVVPADGSISVALNSSVVAIFSEEMNSSTINTSTFRLYNGNIKVSGDVQYTGTTAIFTPSSNLSSETLYTATVLYTVTDLSGNAMTENYSWSFTTGVTTESVPPRVLVTDPEDGGIYDGIRSITADFSEDMYPSDISSSTFTVNDGTSDLPGTVIYDATVKRAVFTPSSSPIIDTAYTATISRNVRDLAGNKMAENKVWTFNFYSGVVPDNTAPVVDAVSPPPGATGVNVHATISAMFSEPLDPATVNTSTFKVYDSIDNPVDGTVTYSESENMIIFTLNSGQFTYYETYLAHILTAVTDIAGNPLASEYVWHFRADVVPDTTAPQVSASTPQNGDTDVPVDSTITLNFGEIINTTTLDPSAFTLKDSALHDVTGTFNVTDRSATFTPDSTLSLSTRYTANFDGSTLYDLSGNADPAYIYSVTFETAGPAGPVVSATVPAGGATLSEIPLSISATFSVQFKAGTIDSNSFYVKDPLNNLVPGSLNIAGSSVNFTATAGFDFATTYTVTIVSALVTDYNGNPILGSDYTWSFTTGADTTKPTVPGEFGITSIDKSTGSVTLSWIASTDNSRVDYYHIFRNNFTTPITTATGTTYTDTGLADSTSYTYTVSAVDRFGNESDQSQQAKVSILDLDITPPTKPGNFTATGVSASKMYLTWDASTDNGSVMNYVLVRLYPSATFTLGNGVREYYDEPLSAGTGYSYQIWACDNASPANCSAVAEAIGFTQASVVSSAHMTLPDTGQDSVTINDATIFGDDADYWSLAYHPMSHTDNSNGTVRDNRSGLVWQQSDDNAVKTASEAGAYCSNLNLGGYAVGTWHLPTKKELVTIVNYGDVYTAPAINPQFTGIDGVLSSPGYWTSTEYASDTAKQWFISFYDGGMNVASKTSGKYALCVQGSRPAQSWTDQGDGTVHDNVTGLVWQQTPYNGSMDWYSAIDTCEGLALSVYDDWRLPNIKELESITDDTQPDVTINRGYFPDASALFYWSSSTYVPDTNNSWRIGFGPNSINGTYTNGDGYVRCVRGYGY